MTCAPSILLQSRRGSFQPHPADTIGVIIVSLVVNRCPCRAHHVTKTNHFSVIRTRFCVLFQSLSTLKPLEPITMRYATLVTGPAGAGKSTFCASLITHAQTIGRRIHLVNLDPAAERFEYTPAVDIKDLINLQDVMEELEFGPNGGLIYCFE